MAFATSLEFKFASVNQTPATTKITANVYIVADGGVVNGEQQYNRTFVTSVSAQVDAGELRQVIINKMTSRLNAINTAQGLGFTANRLICSLPPDFGP